MATETLHMKVGPLIGEQLLEITQTNISKGNIKYAMSVYPTAFGMTDEHTLMILKNQVVVVTDEDGEGVRLTDWENEIKANAHNIFDWESIINERNRNLNELLNNINKTENIFTKYYNGNIRDYNMLEMMKRYYNDEEMKVMSGKANIAARICGHTECKICDKGSSNPWSIWGRLGGHVESYLADIDDGNEIEYDIPKKWEIVLYLTVRYNKLIRILYKEYANFENTYLFLVEHDFIKKIPFIETTIERIISTLVDFCDTGEGYYHPLCNEGLANYKETLYGNILKTKYGKEFAQDGIIKKDILDGYDAGWLSPDGEFYGANGETSAMIHMRLAEQIFKAPCNIYAVRMSKDGVTEWGGVDAPEYWLEKHGWIKIHHQDCYGSFIGLRNEEPTKDFPYAYNPTEIQVKMICDYGDKFYGGTFFTEPDCMGRFSQKKPFKTYAVRQMDDLGIHRVFGR